MCQQTNAIGRQLCTYSVTQLLGIFAYNVRVHVYRDTHCGLFESRIEQVLLDS